MFQIGRNKLRDKIFVMSMVVSIIPVLVGGALVVYVFDLVHEDRIAASEANLVLRQAGEVEDLVEKRVAASSMDVNTDADSLIGPTEGVVGGEQLPEYLVSPRVLEEKATDIIDAGYIEVSVVDDRSGIEVMYASVFASTTRGRLHHSAPGEAEANNALQPEDMEYFEVARAGETYTGSVELTLNGPVAQVAHPLENNQGQVIGVVSGIMDLSPMVESFEGKGVGASSYSYLVDQEKRLTGKKELQLGESAYVYLVDSKGRLLAHSDSSKRNTHFDFLSLPAVKSVLSGATFSDQDSLLYYDSLWGERVVAAGAPVVSPPVVGAVVVEWPLDDANSTFNTLRIQLLLFLALTFVLAMAGSIFMAHKILQPMEKLEEGAKKVAEGKLDYSVEVNTNDEIEDFAETFNEMIEGLKRLDELKKEFVFVASHELKAPVNAINGYISMIAGGEFGEVNEEIEEFLGEIKTSSERLKRLVRDLLEIARSEAGRLEIEVSPVEVVKPIKEVIQELKSLADEKSIELVYSPPKDIPKVLADEDRIKEVMVNLLSNAIKYTTDEGRITVEHELKDDKVVTHVRDEGIGMTEEEQSHLFEKFFRAENEETQDVEGTGLGLFIVKEIIEKMNGEIWVESKKGFGSTFSFSLPIVQD